MHRLAKWVCLSGNVLNWFQTYITGRDFYVSLGDHVSVKHDVSFGVAHQKTELIRNSVARLLTKTKKREPITPVLAELHLLPVSYRR